MADIFLSYAREDKEAAQRLADALSSSGYDVWWDPDIPAGPSFTQVIEEALASAKCVVVLWSGASVRSGWVQDEAREGQERGVLVTARLENVKPPLGFRGHQLADLATWGGDAGHHEFLRLLRGIQSYVRHPARQTAPLSSLAPPPMHALQQGSVLGEPAARSEVTLPDEASRAEVASRDDVRVPRDTAMAHEPARTIEGSDVATSSASAEYPTPADTSTPAGPITLGISSRPVDIEPASPIEHLSSNSRADDDPLQRTKITPLPESRRDAVVTLGRRLNTPTSIDLYNDAMDEPLGSITESDLEVLTAALEHNHADEHEYYISPDTIDFIADLNATEHLIDLLKRALGTAEGMDIKWIRRD